MDPPHSVSDSHTSLRADRAADVSLSNGAEGYGAWRGLWGVGLGLRVQGKPGAAKGWVVLAGGLVAERGFEQLGGGGGV